MIRNPFARKPKTPVEQAVDAFDSVRADAAGYAEAIRDAAADIAETLTEIGPPAKKRRLPLIVAGVAAVGLGIAYLARSKGGAGGDYTPEAPREPAVAVSNGNPPPESLRPTPSEKPKEPKAGTAESTAADE
jgi:hypothetical protein